MQRFGWARVTQIDNSSALGGGWGDDLLNDQCYARVLETAKQGGYDAIMIAFACEDGDSMQAGTAARCSLHS